MGAQGAADARAGMVRLSGGTFRMGTQDGPLQEGPAHEVRLSPFWMDRTEVTVAAFAEFVRASGHVTDAERTGESGVFDLAARRWTRVKGASWRQPNGPAGPRARPNEPVTQVSWADAAAYARWAGKRLPTEAEWEYAARGGLVGAAYSWGNALRPNGKPVANWWQGTFPEKNTREDGYEGVAPVGSFPANGFGLRDLTGNVWEWCADWYSDSYFSESATEDPRGPSTGTERVMRGGSFLCAENHCTNFRVAGRSRATPDSALNNVGFRCVADGPPQPTAHRSMSTQPSLLTNFLPDNGGRYGMTTVARPLDVPGSRLTAACAPVLAKPSPAKPVRAKDGFDAFRVPTAKPKLPPLPPSVLDPNFRLPTTVVPRRYSPLLTVDPSKERFQGEMDVDLQVEEPTPNLILHASGLDVKSAAVRIRGQVHRPVAVRPVEASQTVVLQFVPPLPAGRARLSLSWEGPFLDAAMGMGHYGPVASTFFEPGGARLVFPCFDEPGFKARWQWNLRVPKGQVALTNGGLAAHRNEGETDLVRFHEMGPIPTYLAVLGVGPFRSTAPKVVRGVPMRIHTTSDQLQKLKLAEEVGAKAVEQLTDYFGVPYGFDRLETVSLPGDVGGMEHAGLITMSDAFMLADGASPRDVRRLCTMVTFHEVAHQWFGNMVTLSWWNDLWLNEAFATWMASKLCSKHYPELRNTESEQGWVQEAMETDSLESTRPVRREVKNVFEAEQAFDLLTYVKGGSVLTMLEGHMGPEALRAGLQRYMKAHLHANATSEDLWRALDEQAVQGGLTAQGLALPSEIAKPWIEQSGFPGVRARLEDGKVTLSQARFFSQPGKTSEALWPIPVTLKFEDDAGVHTRSVLLTERQQSIDLGAQGKVKWMWPNADSAGWFRVALEGPAHSAMVGHLGSLSPIERMGFVNDAWSSARAATLGPSAFLDLAAKATQDPDALVLRNLLTRYQYLDQHLVSPADLPAFHAWLSRTLRPRLDALGWDAKAGEPSEDAERRTELLALVGALAKDPAVVAEATRRAKQWLAGDPGAISPALLDHALHTAAASGDPELFNQLVKRAEAETDPGLKDKLWSATAYFSDPPLAKKALELALARLPIDFMVWARSAFAVPGTQRVAWEYVRDNWPALRDRLKDPYLINGVVSTLMALPGRDFHHEAKAFFDQTKIPEAEATVAQVLESLKQGAELATRLEAPIADWIKAQAGTRELRRAA